jgi:hypothetical protein
MPIVKPPPIRPPHPITRRRQRNPRRKDGRSWRGGVTGFCVIAGCFAITWLVAPDWVTAHNPLVKTTAEAGQSLEGHRAGSIFISSMNQDTCRQLSFDNVSGRQWDFGTVDCRDAILANRKNPINDRMNAITDAFRQK